MKNGVGAICISGQCSERELSFEEILLGETPVEGDIWVWKEALRSVGGINYRLRSKQGYELLIRIAKEYKVLQLDQETAEEFLSSESDDGKSWVYFASQTDADEVSTELEDGWKTDCYLVGRYKQELLSMGCLEDAVLSVLSLSGRPGSRITDRGVVVQYLEQMLAGNTEFYDIYDCTQPILIYMGSDICHNNLNAFAQGLGRALEESGQTVEYFDMSKQELQEHANYAKRRFKASICMYFPVLSIKWNDGSFVYNNMSPKYYFYFDHPIWGKADMEQIPCGLCVLTSDGNYAKFVEDYYGHSARFLPPAGIEGRSAQKEKEYGIIFLGRYYGAELLEIMREIRSYDKKWGYILNRYVLYMRKNLSETPEHGFIKASEYYGVTYTRQEFMEMFYSFRRVFIELASYYRNKVIKTLLEDKITLHVFGDTWKESPLWGHPGLICHEEVSAEEALEVYAKSKLSLNIMTWHKDGFTERIANAMLQKSVVVTDRTTYLEKNFVNGEDLLMFDLGHLQELSEQIRELLDDEDKRKRMAENGYRKASQNHTWKQRAEKILEFIEEDRRLV